MKSSSSCRIILLTLKFPALPYILHSWSCSPLKKKKKKEEAVIHLDSSENSAHVAAQSEYVLSLTQKPPWLLWIYGSLRSHAKVSSASRGWTPRSCLDNGGTVEELSSGVMHRLVGQHLGRTVNSIITNKMMGNVGWDLVACLILKSGLELFVSLRFKSGTFEVSENQEHIRITFYIKHATFGCSLLDKNLYLLSW